MKVRKLIPFTLVCVTLTEALRYLSYEEIVFFSNTTAIQITLSTIAVLSLVLLLSKGSSLSVLDKRIKYLLFAWWALLFINFLRGVYTASSYWDWKFLFLSNAFYSCVSFFLFISLKAEYLRTLTSFLLKYFLPLSIIFIPLSLTSVSQLFGRISMPVYLLILIIPFVKSIRFRFSIVGISILSLLVDLSFRINFIRIVLAFTLLVSYRMISKMSRFWLSCVHGILFILPLVFVFLGLTGGFSFFEQLSAKNGFEIVRHDGGEESFTGDTRTFLYAEVFASLDKSGKLFFGEGSSGSYDSYWFIDDGGAMNGRRYSTEVAFLNLLLYFGVFGVFLYGVLLFSVSKLAILDSGNILSKLIGFYITLKWPLSFVEEFTNFDLNNGMLWIAIGIVSQRRFRYFDFRYFEKQWFRLFFKEARRFRFGTSFF